MPDIQVRVYHKHGKMPTQATDRAQCIDFYAAENFIIYPGQTKVIDLGVKLILPEGYGLEFRERSGLATKGIIIGAGVIDEDYHGPLKAVVRWIPTDGRFNRRYEDGRLRFFEIKAGDKIVQAELVKRIPITIKDIGPLTFADRTISSQRADKGFGSSDE